ncbi:MAG TPA: SDR family NAD(P)-dependent oxidoreductase, partial [Chthonomonadales bacterium]|nr:SDR family NAD(P)-dependent oxidoreductase [Chthonomonadales bacterium]
MTTRRVALITGGSRGIGLGIARALAAEGCDLAINGVREESAVAPILEELRTAGVEVLYIPADISQNEARTALVNAVRNRFGRLNVLVNNAGVAPSIRADILEASEESFERLVGINLRGPYFLTQNVARWMIEQKHAESSFSGCIVNITSISSTVASP